MKKTNLLFVSCLILMAISQAISQNVPNGGFEDWDINKDGGNEPVSWQTLNEDDFTNVSQVTGHSGQYAAKLSVEWHATNEMYVAPMFFLDGNFSISERFTALEFYVQGSASGSDYFSVSVGMFKDGRNIGGAIYQLNQVYSSWTKISAAIEYSTNETPDECFIGIHIYPVMGATNGTNYTIDDLVLTMNSGTTTLNLIDAITNSEGTVFELTFSAAMSDPSGKQGQFSGSRNGNTIGFTSASLKPGNDQTIKLTLASPVLANENLKVSYTAGTVSSSTGTPLESFTNRTVSNIVGGTSAGWQIIPCDVLENLYSVHFANNMNGFIGGAMSSCLKSTNGGTSWSPVIVPSYADFNSVWATSSNDAFLGGWDTVYITHNNGQSWTGAYTNTMNYAINSLQFISSQNGFAFLPWVSFIKTTDGGNTWSAPTGGFTAWDFYDGFMLDQNTGWGVGDCQNIAKTTDGGVTWLPYEWNSWTELTCNKIWGIKATSELNAWAVADSGIVYRTVDGGNYWSRNIIAGEEDNLKDIYFINANVGYIAGFNGKIFKTTDGGNTWIQEPQMTTQNLNSVFFISENLGWAVGDNGTILRFSGGPVGLFDKQNTGFNEIAIFPNPFPLMSTLSFTLPQSGQVNIVIRDISGCVVKTVYQGKLLAGEHLFAIDMPDASSGVYLCHLSFAGKSSCKTFVVLK